MDTKPRTSHHRWPGGKRRRKSKCSTIRTRKGHRQSDSIGTVSRATVGSLLRDGTERIIMGFSSA